MNGLIIRSRGIDWILAGQEDLGDPRAPHARSWQDCTYSWRQRSHGRDLRARRCRRPLTLRELRKNAKKLAEPKSAVRSLPYEMTYAWVPKNVRRFRCPHRYSGIELGHCEVVQHGQQPMLPCFFTH